jgi:hypothetical protein
MCRKVLYQRGLPAGAVPFCSFQHSSLVTAIVTVKLQPKRRKQPDSIGTVDLSAVMNNSRKTRTGERIASGLLIPCAFVSSDNDKAFHAM